MAANPRYGAMPSTTTKVWDTPNPRKKSKKLTPAQKAKAKAAAKKAGRRYPNLVDNMRVASKSAKKGKKKK